MQRNEDAFSIGLGVLIVLLLLAGVGVVAGLFFFRATVATVAPARPLPPAVVAAPSSYPAIATLDTSERAAVDVELEEVEAELSAAEVESAEPLSGSLLVRIAWPDGTPAEDVGLHLGYQDGNTPSLRARTDAQGEARLSELPLGRVRVQSDRVAHRNVELLADEEVVVEIAIPAGAHVRGLVHDANGAPVAGAEIWISHFGNSSWGSIVSESDAEGRFVLRHVEAYCFLGARAAGYGASYLTTIDAAENEVVEVEIELGAEACAVEGVVVDDRGTPVPGAELKLGNLRPGPQYVDGQMRRGPAPSETAADAQGAFALEGVRPGERRLTVSAPGYAGSSLELELVGGVREHVRVELPRGGELHARVVDGKGEPVEAALVRVNPSTRELARSANTDADGWVRLEGIVPGQHPVQVVSRRSGELESELSFESGQATLWTAQLRTGGELAGRVVDERHQPLSGWLVAAVDPNDQGDWTHADYTDAEGAFHIPDLPEEAFDLLLSESARSSNLTPFEFERYERGDMELLIVVPDSARQSAWILGRVLDASGAPAAQVGVMYGSARHRGRQQENVDPETGRFEIGPLVPGYWELQVQSADYPMLPLDAVELAADERLDLGLLQLGRGGTISVSWNTPEGARLPPSLSAYAVRGSGRARYELPNENQSGRRAPLLAPGMWRVGLRGTDWYAPEVEVQVVSDQEATVVLELEPACSGWVEFALPEEASFHQIRGELRDESGALVQEWSIPSFALGDDRRMSITGLPAGTYDVALETDSELRGTGSIVLSEQGYSHEAGLRIELH